MTLQDAFDQVVGMAAEEYAEYGVIHVDTFIRMTNLGLDAEAITTQIENGDL